MTVTIDWVTGMNGKKTGLVGRTGRKNDKQNFVFYMEIDYITHQHSFRGETLKYEQVMKVAALPVPIFLSEIDAEFWDVLYHTEVRWLIRGRVLTRLLASRLETEMFVTEKGKVVIELSDEGFGILHCCVISATI
jgi:hypothetical protein